MTESQSTKLEQLLTETKQPDWKRSAQALTLAFAWNQEALSQVKANRADLLRALAELATALATGLVSTSGLSGLVNEAFAGQPLREAVRGQQKALSEHAREVETLKKDMAELEKLEKENRALLIEQKQLQERWQTLSSLKSFDPSAVDELRRQVLVLENAKPWLSNLDELIKKLEEELPPLNQVSGDVLMQLQQKDRDDLKKAQNTLDELQSETRRQSAALEQLAKETESVQADITEKKKRFEETNQEFLQQKEILEKYIRIDKEIAKAINNREARQAQNVLDEIEKGLQGVDEALRLAIAINEKEGTIKPIPL